MIISHHIVRQLHYLLFEMIKADTRKDVQSNVLEDA
jgi:hypothetical protein